MIPFSLISGVALTTNDALLEFSVLSLAPCVFSFRLPKGEEPRISSFRLYFYDRKENERMEIVPEVTDLTVAEEGRYSRTYSASVQDASYAAAVCAFSQDYLSFVEGKLTLSDAEFAASVTAYPAEKENDFSASLEIWMRKHFSSLQDEQSWAEALSGIGECAVILRANLQSQFLSLPLDAFLRNYWSRAGLGAHPISRLPIRCLYFGHESCRFLLPELPDLRLLLERCAEEGLSSVLLLPPMKAREEAERRELFSFLASLPTALQPKEIVLNDYGSAVLAREEAPSLCLRLGTLLCKTAKDPRAGYVPASPAASPLSSPGFLRYLQDKLGICRYSAEGFPGAALPAGATALHLPFARTNTSALCPLRPVVEGKDRSMQRALEACEKPCLSNALLYPDFLNLIGADNSLWACTPGLLRDSSLLKQDAQGQIERIVFNFL